MNRKEFLNNSVSLLILGSLSLISLQSFGKDEHKKYKVIAKRCDGCGHCSKACHEKALKINGKVALIDKTKCKGCGDCVRYCRKQAIVADTVK